MEKFREPGFEDNQKNITKRKRPDKVHEINKITHTKKQK